MRKALLTIVALMSLTAAQAQTPVKAWYKTWITPEKCVTGITEITYDAENDYYTVADGLAGDSAYPMFFGFDYDDNGYEYIRLCGYTWSDTESQWSNYNWYSDGTQIGFTANTDEVWADMYTGNYPYRVGSKPGEGTGALYMCGDTWVDYYTNNFWCQPTFVWPATEPVDKMKGTYRNGRTRQTKDCEMWVYANGLYVIKGFNGIAGYDITFDPTANTLMADNMVPTLYDPSAYEGYTFSVYERMATWGKTGVTDNIAKVMNVTAVNVDAANHKATFTYDYADYNVSTDSTTVKAAGATDTFTWDPTTSGITSASAATTAPAQYYNVGGARVAAPGRGMVIRRQDGKAVKLMRR